jgi:hypothetical protein
MFGFSKDNSFNKFKEYIKNKTTIEEYYEPYVNYMKCKYDKLLIEYAIKYKKKEDLVVWAVNNNFYYDPIHCNLAAENRLPKALEAMLKDNQIKETISNKRI